MYRAVPAQVDLPAMEHEVLRMWDEERVFEASVAQSEGRPTWVFYEGPPTANGTPGTHHVEARVFKDVFPRYRTMKGYYVPRQAGWDCHGLPVELAVEKELGFTGKGDIERFGVAEFNARCRESVLRHVDEFSDMTRRMGYWVDMDRAYWTMDKDYVQSVWWSLKQIFDKGLLVQDHRVAPYCPRCGTGLSDHELAQGYETVVDPSVYVRFPVSAGSALAERHPGLALLVWTTTPWTLVSNTAVAVKPDAAYAIVRTRRRRDARRRRGARRVAASATTATVLETMPGTALERVALRAPLRLRRHPRRALRHPRRLRHHRRRLRPRPPGARLRRRGPRHLPRLRPARRQPRPPRRPLRRRRARGRRDVLQEGRRDARRRPRAARADVPPRALRARLPALLALPHAAHLLRAAVLVHPHDGDQGRAARSRTSRRTGSPAPSSGAATATG